MENVELVNRFKTCGKKINKDNYEEIKKISSLSGKHQLFEKN